MLTYRTSVTSILLFILSEATSRSYEGPWQLGPAYRHGPDAGLQLPWLPQKYLEGRERLEEQDAHIAAEQDLREQMLSAAAREDVSFLERQVDRSMDEGIHQQAAAAARNDQPENSDEQPKGHTTPKDPGTRDPVAVAYRGSAHEHDNRVIAKASSFTDVYFVALVAGCSAVAVIGVVAAGFCFYKVQRNGRAAADVEYPAYGVTGPNKEAPSPTADRKLAQSAQMYHFQHQKQQMIAMEKNHTNRHTSASDVDTEEENEEGDYTVYECPGLAPTGEMEVKNPLFNDDQTPVSPPLPNGKQDPDKGDKQAPPSP
ncbi:neural proliferation differentiation and control protein 1-like [Ornithodoros turicata]|uniref:neural proliferation differentiation and control protein 1-like n=1 Tax=Ornithodoros turicata TaxID=34597 RepID=UPI00313A2B47